MNTPQVQRNRSIKRFFQKLYRIHTYDLYIELNLLKVRAIKMYRLQAWYIKTNKVFYLHPLEDKIIT